ncbi:MAG: hypothetical protein ACR2PT_11315 [Endozoicomonas sp.]
MSIKNRVRLLQFCYMAMPMIALYSIPWFDNPDQQPELLFGLPLWVARAVACLLIMSLLSLLAWYLQAALSGKRHDV